MTPIQCRMARAALKWSAKDLAERAGAHLNTVARFEDGGNAQSEMLARFRRAFENNGIRFTGAGVEHEQWIWKLEPINPDDPNWQASTYRDEILVRAPSEEIARSRATIAFAIAVKRELGQPVRFCPWKHADLVRAHRERRDEGQTAIIKPEHGDMEVPRDWDQHPPI